MSSNRCDICNKNPGHDWVSLRIMRHGVLFDVMWILCGTCYLPINQGIMNGVNEARKAAKPSIDGVSLRE